MSIWGKSWGISGGRGGTDTGLGWYADSAYLAENTGLIGKIETGSITPISGYSRIAGIYQDGTASVIDTGLNSSLITAWESYVLATAPIREESWLAGAWQPVSDCLVFGNYSSYGIHVSWDTRWFCPQEYNTWLHYECIDSSLQLYCNGVALSHESLTHGSTTYNQYIFKANGIDVPTSPNLVLGYLKYFYKNNQVIEYIPVSRNLDGAIGLLEVKSVSGSIVTTSFYQGGGEYVGSIPGGGSSVEYRKSTSGYSVTCMCKWRTSYGGDVYFSPVLISSNSSYTAFTKNSTAITSPTSYTYDGMTFYMLKDTSTTLDGTETIIAYVPELDLTSRGPMADMGIFYAVINAAGLGVS